MTENSFRVMAEAVPFVLGKIPTINGGVIAKSARRLVGPRTSSMPTEEFRVPLKVAKGGSREYRTRDRRIQK